MKLDHRWTLLATAEDLESGWPKAIFRDSGKIQLKAES